MFTRSMFNQAQSIQGPKGSVYKTTRYLFTVARSEVENLENVVETVVAVCYECLDDRTECVHRADSI
jgi:hypothetical protein